VAKADISRDMASVCYILHRADNVRNGKLFVAQGN